MIPGTLSVYPVPFPGPLDPAERMAEMCATIERFAPFEPEVVLVLPGAPPAGTDPAEARRVIVAGFEQGRSTVPSTSMFALHGFAINATKPNYIEKKDTNYFAMPFCQLLPIVPDSYRDGIVDVNRTRGFKNLLDSEIQTAPEIPLIDSNTSLTK